jgi:FixJ family two-component response regulator
MKPAIEQRTTRVKDLLAEGLSNKEIADRLHVSLRTVKEHIRFLLRERGLYGLADSRRLIVGLVREKMFALTAGAGNPTLPASVTENTSCPPH